MSSNYIQLAIEVIKPMVTNRAFPLFSESPSRRGFGCRWANIRRSLGAVWVILSRFASAGRVLGYRVQIGDRLLRETRTVITGGKRHDQH